MAASSAVRARCDAGETAPGCASYFGSLDTKTTNQITELIKESERTGNGWERKRRDQKDNETTVWRLTVKWLRLNKVEQGRKLWSGDIVE